MALSAGPPVLKDGSCCFRRKRQHRLCWGPRKVGFWLPLSFRVSFLGQEWTRKSFILRWKLLCPVFSLMVFPVVMYGCEGWTIKKAECWRTDAFELWCWRLLRVPWTARRSNQPILKEISPGCSLEGLMLKLKLQYSGHLMGRADSFEKALMLGKTEGRRRRGRQRWGGWMASLTQWTWVWVNSGSWWRTGRPGMLRFMGLQRVGHDWATELNWTETFSKETNDFDKTLEF